MSQRATVPRGRHAPPLEVRLSVQRRRLFRAAASVFAGVGYAEASAEAIARRAGMSKATFYEHFANKEECILALFDEAATVVLHAMADAARDAGSEPRERLRSGIRAFLDMLAEHPAASQTLLVEIMAAGDRGAERRDSIMAAFAATIDAENAAAARSGGLARLESPDEAFAIVGAVAELASRQLRLGDPADIRDLEPVIERLMVCLMTPAPAA
ncbi:MAG: TetR/AcrR family transcriptional regulator [Solirubrobacteraceae bacterium]|jgi:AcrR family transcriptional regulator